MCMCLRMWYFSSCVTNRFVHVHLWMPEGTFILPWHHLLYPLERDSFIDPGSHYFSSARLAVQEALEILSYPPLLSTQRQMQPYLISVWVLWSEFRSLRLCGKHSYPLSQLLSSLITSYFIKSVLKCSANPQPLCSICYLII